MLARPSLKAIFHLKQLSLLFLSGLLALCCLQRAAAAELIAMDLQMPKPGDHSLRILSPDLLELVLINTKQPQPAHVDSWDWVDGQGVFVPPNMTNVHVLVNGQTNSIIGVGFKRRPLYAPLAVWDLRIANQLYLQLSSPITNGQSVAVVNDGTLWPTNMAFAAVADPLRYNPAIHVNQEGYLPAYPKKASVGYYVGSLGEMVIPTNRFFIVTAQSGVAVYQGTMTLRSDVGFVYTPTPHQVVYDVDFSSFTTPGEYRVLVPGMGSSLPFHIDEGIGMDFARTYALGLFHQRSGYNVDMPFTRFTHAIDHISPTLIPTNASAPFVFTWNTIADNASRVNSDNPPQTAPLLTSPAAQLYPFVNQGPVLVGGGHFEAANYSKVAWNMAQTVHGLMFAVDALPGVGALDNLGLPESGDGISDVLQEAKWEADGLAKMQDTDGGFYYMIYPLNREYEGDVLPENGDPQVVWPKNTATTAASVAALAQCASSPRFKQAYPQVASNYWAQALLGWKFLTNAIALHGSAGGYQKMMHFDDAFTDQDDLAWAACELYLATGDPQYHTALQSTFPNPTNLATARWGWWRMYACYGNAIRAYATAVSSGRLTTNQLNQAYLAQCVNVITNWGNDNLRWSQENAYGSSFPDYTKRVRSAGWYFSAEQAFDMVVAQQFNTNALYVNAILQNLNYEAGCNPINMTFVTGIGWKRQREIVDQYSANDRRTMPKSGIPVSNLQEGFTWTWTYGGELSALCSPSDGAATSPYPIYDRWSDFWNVYTESSTVNTVRSFVTAASIAAQTSLAGQPWRSTNATIIVPATPGLGQPVTVTLQVADTNLSGAKIVWEARNQEPAFGGLNYTFTPVLDDAPYWVEAEVQWPDGRRAFAVSSVIVSTNAPPQLSNSQSSAGGGFSFQLVGTPLATYVIQASTNLTTWVPVATNTLSASGVLQFADPQASTFWLRYYRAVRVP
jgi:hypothetical protein